MSENWLERALHERINSMEPSIDMEAAWDRLNGQRKRKRKGFIWWWTSAGVLLAGLIVWMLLSVNSASAPGPLDTFLAIPALAIEDRGGEEIPSQSETEQVRSNSVLPAGLHETVFSESVPGSIYPQSADPKTPFSAVETKQQALALLENTPTTIADQERTEIDGHFGWIASLPVSLDPLEISSQLPALQPILQPAVEMDRSKLSGWSVELMAGYAGNTLQKSPLTTDDIQFRSVDRQYGGLRLGYALTENWSVSVGLEYALVMHQSSGIMSVNSDVMEQDVLLEIRQYADGTLEEVTGAGIVGKTTTTTFNTWERHRFFTIPLELAYRHTLTHAIGLEYLVGVGYSPVIRRTGLRPSNDTGTFLLEEVGQIGFRESGLIDLRLGLLFRYQWSPHFSLHTGFRAGMDLTDQLEPTAPVQEKYFWLGGSIGLQYHW